MATTSEKTKELFNRIEEGIKSVYEGDNYRHYLATMAKFHRYSVRNCILIHLQRPEATHVAGYNAWKKDFNRHVLSGEKGIQILGYAPKSIKVTKNVLDDAGRPIIGENGQPVKETVTEKIPAYVPVFVFDVSQTDGEPLPKPIYDLDGNFALYEDFLATCQKISPCPIMFDAIPGEARGTYYAAEQLIKIRPGMSQSQTAKTIIHEITHAILHDPSSPTYQNVNRPTREVQAESVAFCVCEHFGLDTSDYSFTYLAHWSTGRELKELERSLDIIQKQSQQLISQIDAELDVLKKQRSPEVAHQEPTEAAFRLATGEYLYLQTSEEGLDYTLYGPAMSLIDGGCLTGSPLTLQAAEGILSSHGLPSTGVSNISPMEFEAMHTSALEALQAKNLDDSRPLDKPQGDTMETAKKAGQKKIDSDLRPALLTGSMKDRLAVARQEADRRANDRTHAISHSIDERGQPHG